MIKTKKEVYWTNPPTFDEPRIVKEKKKSINNGMIFGIDCVSMCLDNYKVDLNTVEINTTFSYGISEYDNDDGYPKKIQLNLSHKLLEITSPEIYIPKQKRNKFITLVEYINHNSSIEGFMLYEKRDHTILKLFNKVRPFIENDKCFIENIIQEHIKLSKIYFPLIIKYLRDSDHFVDERRINNDVKETYYRYFTNIHNRN
jgi:hypothetical protein